MEVQIIASSEEESAFIRQSLQEYNARYMQDLSDYHFHIADNGQIIAGIVAERVFDTLEVDFLFVDSQYRGKGYGRMLLTHVERLARQQRLKRVLLNTYSFQAPEFYRKMGYTQLFCISPAFASYDQIYFEKHL